VNNNYKRKVNSITANAAAAGASSVGIASPVDISAKPVTDPNVLDQGGVFSEAVHQTRPLAEPGSDLAKQASNLIRNGNARHPQLGDETTQRLVTEGKELSDFLKGRYPESKAAEIVVAHDFKAAHAGLESGIINASPSTNPSSNVVDVRVSPDPQARRDILFLIEDEKRQLRFYRSGGQVKTGANSYVSKTVAQLPDLIDYGETAYVDAKYVNPDGSPKVGPDAFTAKQAQLLQKAKVRLRGIPNLEERSEALIKNIVEHGHDGLDPIARQQLKQLRDDIASAYQPGSVAARLAVGAATSAASAALITLAVQVASGGDVDVTAVGSAAKRGALFGAGGTLADAGIYHAATHLGVAPEIAKSLAQQGVTAGFCLITIGTDVLSEVRAANAGELATADAIAGSSAKTALALLPCMLTSLGLAGVPLLVGAQLGGRWAIAKVREADRRLKMLIEEDLQQVASLQSRLDCMDSTCAELRRECDETDEIFDTVMFHGTKHLPTGD